MEKILKNKPWPEVLENTRIQINLLAEDTQDKRIHPAMLKWLEEKGEKVYLEGGWDKLKETMMEAGLEIYKEKMGPLTEYEKQLFKKNGYKI